MSEPRTPTGKKAIQNIDLDYPGWTDFGGYDAIARIEDEAADLERQRLRELVEKSLAPRPGELSGVTVSTARQMLLSFLEEPSTPRDTPHVGSLGYCEGGFPGHCELDNA